MGIAISPIQIDSRVSDFIGKPRKMLIDGKWVTAVSGKTFPTYNPATGEVLAQVAEGDHADIDLAVKAARKAFDNGPWSRLTASERGKLVWKLADLLEEHLEEFATLETLDNGKPLSVARAADVPLAVEMFRYMAGWATKLEGTTIPLSVPYTPGASYPVADGGLEAGASLGLGMHRGIKAGRADSALRSPSGGVDFGSRISRWCSKHRPWIRRNRGSGSGGARSGRQSRLHRIDRSRQIDCPRGHGKPEKSFP
jgi:hypothetical protein